MSVKYWDRVLNKWIIFPGTVGAPGKDAYFIAQENGYKGTKEDFADALVQIPDIVDYINSTDDTPTKDSDHLVTSGGVRDALDELKQDLENQINDTDANITEQIERIDGEISDINENIDQNVTRIDQNITNINNNITNIENDITNIENDIEEINQKIDNNTKDLEEKINQTNADLQSNVTRIDGSINTINENITEVNQKIEQNKTEIDNSITKINQDITTITDTTIPEAIKNSIIDNLTSDDTTKSLSAKQGKVLKEMIDSLVNLQLKVVEQLPDRGESNIIYLVKKDGDENDTHDEYVYVNGEWELIGTTDIDLSDYYTKSEIDSKVTDLSRRVSANSTSIQDITGNGAKISHSLTITANGSNVLNKWKGETDQTVTLTIPTKLSDLQPSSQDIITALTYTPANSTNAVLGPESAVDSNIALFDNTTGKLIKDSGRKVDSFANKTHTHTVSDITDMPPKVVVDDSLSTTSTNPVQNKVITTQLNNKVNNGTLSSYVKTETLNSTLNSYVLNSSLSETLNSYRLVSESYTKDEVNNMLSSSGNGNVLGSDLTDDYVIVGAGESSIKSSNIAVSNILTLDNIDKRIITDALGYTPANNNSIPSTLPNPERLILTVDKILKEYDGSTEVSIDLDTAYVANSEDGIVGALGFTPIQESDIPSALPNPQSLNITAGGAVRNYNGSSVSNINLDNIFAKKLDTVAIPGQPGIFYDARNTAWDVDQIYVTEDNPNAIIVVPSNVTVSFTGYQKMEGLDNLSGGSYKCYCITYISTDLALVNCAIYG